HFNLPPNQVGRERRQSIVLKLCPAVFDREISPFDKAAFVQASDERVRNICRFPRRPCAEVTNRRDSRLLCMRGERPRCRTTDERDEIPPPHWTLTFTMLGSKYQIISQGALDKCCAAKKGADRLRQLWVLAMSKRWSVRNI